MTIHLRRAGVATIAMLVAASAAACGGGSSDTSASTSSYRCEDPNADTSTDISLTGMPIVSNGAIYAGIDNGLFKKHGLNLTMKTVSTVPATVSAVQGGSTDFAFTGTIQLLQAVQSGVRLEAVAPFAGIAPDYYDKMQAGEEGYETEITALLTMNDSGIDDPGDLDGKTVSITDAKGQSELTTRSVIKSNGGDPDSVKFVTLAPADSYNALLAGKVDAAYVVVPTFDGYEEKGAKIISWPGVEALKEGPTSFIVAKSDYIRDNADTVTRFNCAMREVTAFGNSDPDAVREVTAREQGIDPAALATAVVPYFYEKTDPAGVDRFQQLMVDFGFLDSTIDLETVIIPQALSSEDAS